MDEFLTDPEPYLRRLAEEKIWRKRQQERMERLRREQLRRNRRRKRFRHNNQGVSQNHGVDRRDFACYSCRCYQCQSKVTECITKGCDSTLSCFECFSAPPSASHIFWLHAQTLRRQNECIVKCELKRARCKGYYFCTSTRWFRLGSL